MKFFRLFYPELGDIGARAYAQYVDDMITGKVTVNPAWLKTKDGGGGADDTDGDKENKQRKWDVEAEMDELRLIVKMNLAKKRLE